MSALVNAQHVSVGRRMLAVLRKLGSGAFGTVFQVRDSHGNTFALKTIICTNQGSVANALREVETLRSVNHQRIVQIFGVDSCRISGDLYFLILTEFCAGGDLNSRLDHPSDDEKNLTWISQLSDALSYLHSRCPAIVHRDLKADNVLLTDRSTENLKLGDFGLAREYVALRNVDYNAHAMQAYYMNSATGPIHWMAPEFFSQRYTEKADVFSLGGIFYAILERDFVRCGPKKMYGVFLTYSWHGKVGLGYAMSEIDERAKVEFSTSFRGSNSMRRLIKDMLEYDPHERPSATEVKEKVEVIRSAFRLSQPSSSTAQAGTCC